MQAPLDLHVTQTIRLIRLIFPLAGSINQRSFTAKSHA
jgi:hypothetical protein